MKCKRHPCEQGAGVCASCLRERLLALLAAQNQLSPVHDRRNPQASQPPPLTCPQSVSPYASRRRSSYGFFSTPQVGPATSDAAAGRGVKRFSLLSHLFGRRRSVVKEPDPGVSKSCRSRSWISALFRGRRRKPRRFSAEEERPGRARASRRARNRGMSPAIDESDYASDSGYSSASSGAWRMPTPSPMRRAAAAQHQHHHGLSSFAVCLSPLVRTSPGFRRGHTPEVGFSADLRGALKAHHLHASGGAASLAPNRSRKLKDFGRPR